MEFINIELNAMRDRRLARANAQAVGAWFRALCWCSTQENGGLIDDCQEWDDRDWLATLGTYREDVEAAVTDGLLTWQDGALAVWGYRHDLEEYVTKLREKRREAGRKGGLRSGEARRSKFEASDSATDDGDETSKQTSSNASSKSNHKTRQDKTRQDNIGGGGVIRDTCDDIALKLSAPPPPPPTAAVVKSFVGKIGCMVRFERGTEDASEVAARVEAMMTKRPHDAQDVMARAAKQAQANARRNKHRKATVTEWVDQCESILMAQARGGAV